MTFSVRLRLTDFANCAPAGCTGPYQGNAGTAADVDFPVGVDCVAHAFDPSYGSDCDAHTSMDAVLPGTISEGMDTFVQTLRVRVSDSGPNGVRGDSDDQLLATQGIYVP
jgi:hypothetical protein